MLINHPDVEGWSPAHCASAEGHVNILRLLGNYGPMVANDGNGWDFYAESPIDLAIKNYDGESIDDVALPEKRDEILQVLSGNYTP
jgi:ankyrin repeat protein